MPRLEGVYAPIPTPFTPSSDLDWEALKLNLEFWNSFPLAGYVVLGSNGEAVHLREPEKLALIDRVRQNAPEERQVIAGTGLFSTTETSALTRSAAEAGAGAALVLPPFYFRGQMTNDVLARHFRTVADESPIPVIVYNMPANTALDMPAPLLAQLSEHENIAGLKDSSGNIAKLSELRQGAAPGFALLAGSAGFFLPALAAGADGGVLALANIAPQICLEILALSRGGDWERARSLQARIARANRAVTRQWGVPALKAAMDLIGLSGGLPRPPLIALAEGNRRELQTILTEAGIHAAKETE